MTAICQLSDAENVAYMHLPFDNTRYSHPVLAVTSITFFFCVRWEVRFIWNKQKQQSKCYIWTKSTPVQKNVPRPNRSNVGPERSRTDQNLY